MPESLLTVTDLGVSYAPSGFSLLKRAAADRTGWALDGVSLSVAPGESVAIVGESGSGKSTLARAIVGLNPISRGSITLAGEQVDRNRTRAQRQFVQLIFQDPYSSLNPRMTVEQAITEAIRFHRMRTGSSIMLRMHELLELVNLPRSIAASYPRNLSGGQRQRVCIARALATEPRLLVADEPVSALDVSVQAAILNLFADLQAELGVALLMISHNLSVVRHISRRVAVMYAGRIVEFDTAENVMERPTHDYTRKLISAVPSLVPRTRPPTTPVSTPDGKA